VRGSDTVARLGGDEFGLLLPELSDGDGALPVITRVRAGLERPVYVHSLPLAVEASIGIAIYPDHGINAQSLIQKADVAMYDSKRDNASHTFYDEGSHEYDVTRLTLVAELRRALVSRELILHYSPRRRSRTAGSARWRHCCAGCIRSAASCSRTRSFRSPRRPG
jgi:diguanylate cyclase